MSEVDDSSKLWNETLSQINEGQAKVQEAIKEGNRARITWERSLDQTQLLGKVTQGEVDAMRRSILAGKYPNATPIEAATLFGAAADMFNNGPDAIKAMPMLNDYNVVSKSLYGLDNEKSRGEVDSLVSIAKSLGLQGDLTKIKALGDMAGQARMATDNNWDANKLKSLVGSVGANEAQHIDVDGLRHLLPLIDKMGAEKAGSGIGAGVRALLSGQLSKQQSIEMHRLGLVDEQKNEAGLRARFGEKWTLHRDELSEESVVDADLLKRNPAAWLQTAALPKLAEKGAKSESAIVNELGRILPAGDAVQAFGLLATKRKDFDKIMARMASRGSLAQQADEVRRTSGYKDDEFAASKETLSVNAGMGYKAIYEQMLAVLNKILAGINAWSASHPDSTTAIVTGITALGLSISAIKGKRWIQSLYSLLRGKGAAAAGAEVVTAFPKLFGADMKAAPSLFGRLGKLLKMPISFLARQIKGLGGLLLRGVKSLPWGRMGGMLLRAGTGIVARLGPLLRGLAGVVPTIVANLGGLAGGLARGAAGLLAGGGAGAFAAVAAAGYGGWKFGGYLNGKINEWTEAHLGEKSFGAWLYDWVHKNDVDPGPLKQEKKPAAPVAPNAPTVSAAPKPPQPAPAKPVSVPPPPKAATEAFSPDGLQAGSILAAIRDELARLHADMAALAQKQVTMTVDGRELGRVVANALGREFQKPSVSGSGVDKRRHAPPTAMQTYA